MSAQGHGTVDFGAAPGTGGTGVTLHVGSQGGILTSSDVEVWLRCEDSADHSADEHFIENIRVRAGKIIAADGFDVVPECLLGTTWGVWNYSWVWN
jgi:hypothetical protein